MQWFNARIQNLHDLVARPGMLTMILIIDVLAYFGGLLYWYGDVMSHPNTPAWSWPFIPDCPLFGLLGGLGLLMVIAHQHWSDSAIQRTQRVLLIIAILSTAIWLLTYLPTASKAWVDQQAMLSVWAISLLIAGLFFHKAPRWLLGIYAFGQIKYGIWTVTAWLLFWQNTAIANDAPNYTFDSIFMTITHIGLIGQGILLLTYFKADVSSAIASLLWFGLSDYMDYGLGFYPLIPQEYIPLFNMQWSTIAVTAILTVLYIFGVGKNRNKLGVFG